MTFLWTFENRTRAEPLIASLTYADILFEAQSKGNEKAADAEVTISVDDSEYIRAKKILLKHKKRRTTT